MSNVPIAVSPQPIMSTFLPVSCARLLYCEEWNASPLMFSIPGIIGTLGSTCSPVQMATCEQSKVRSLPSVCFSTYLSLCIHLWSAVHHVQPCGVVVTTCPFSFLDPRSVNHRARFTRVLRSPESQRIVNAIFGAESRSCIDEKSVPLWRNGDDNVWLAGGWCWDGMVLLEGCVVSAMRVADAFDVEVPWRH
jgi:hypothetical protein